MSFLLSYFTLKNTFQSNFNLIEHELRTERSSIDFTIPSVKYINILIGTNNNYSLFMYTFIPTTHSIFLLKQGSSSESFDVFNESRIFILHGLSIPHNLQILYKFRRILSFIIANRSISSLLLFFFLLNLV